MLSIKFWLIKIWSAILPAILPPIHITLLYYFWGSYARRVDRRYCSCSCWDTVYKGTYESGIASYKHVYFNATTNTIKIWLLTVFSILLLYECCKYLFTLIFKCQIRLSMFILFMSSCFAHYYSWWIYFNYWNDEFYVQWSHQSFFTLTELISTGYVISLTNKNHKLTYRKCLVIVSIALVHIFASSWDQFFVNVIQAKGDLHQIVRDIGFMVPDVLHVIFPLLELICSRKRCSSGLKKDLIIMFVLVVSGIFISSIL